MVSRDKAVVVVVAHKSQLTVSERVSFIRCVTVLASHPIVLLCPEGMDVGVYRDLGGNNFQVYRVPREALESRQSYNRLKSQSQFYKLFRDFEYLLTYELDAYVFDDQLVYWCDQGYDYIGAPWFDKVRRTEKEGKRYKNLKTFRGAGNSGFSLRNVQACLRALKELEKRPQVRHRHEDLFWCRVVPEFTTFNVAAPEEALRFSFEVQPGYLYKLNNYRLPFGCHAWRRRGPKFWREHIDFEDEAAARTLSTGN